jgi:hypothetical protein
MNWERDLALDRALEETRMETLAQAHIDSGEKQCEECGEWVDEDDLVPYQEQNLFPNCRREYVFADFEELAKIIPIDFGQKTGKIAEKLLASMKAKI